MRTKGLVIPLFGALALALTSCQQKSSQTAEVNPIPPASSDVTQSTTTQAPAAAASPVTADPVAASQHNATRRRERRQGPPASSSRREGGAGYDTGYSEERRGERERAATHEHEVPPGTILRVAFDKPISTATAKVGDLVRGELLDSLLAEDGVVVAASGSRVVGRVEHVAESGKLGGQAELRFRLSELTPTGGRPVAISTSTYERRGESHAKRNAEYIAGGAAVGALLGQIIGRDTESTLKGAAAGAAAGTGVAAATGDLNFEIEAGRTVAFTLEQPLRLPAAR